MTAQPRFRRYASEVRARMLIEAGLACLARGGITVFTVDNVCREAGASRGLITHHFGSKDALLAAVFAAAYRPRLDHIGPGPDGHPLDLPTLIDRIFVAEKYTRETLNLWLAIWGETAANPAMQAEHRRNYDRYHATLNDAIAAWAAARGRVVLAGMLASAVIALADGFWLEQCIDPARLAPDEAKQACLALLQPVLGPLA